MGLEPHPLRSDAVEGSLVSGDRTRLVTIQGASDDRVEVPGQLLLALIE
jgi:hypothetical protein